MTFLEAAIEVLRNATDALHFSEIAQRAVNEKLLSHVGRDPQAAMRTCLNSAVRGGDSVLERTKPGYYKIREGASLPELPPRPARTKKQPSEEKAKAAAPAKTSSSKKVASKKVASKKKVSTKEARPRSRAESRKIEKKESAEPAQMELTTGFAVEEKQKRDGHATVVGRTSDESTKLKSEHLEFEAPQGSGIEGVTDVALVMANAMSRLAEERPELRQELESMQQRSLATNHEPPVSKRLSAPHRRPSTNNGDERLNRKKRRRRRPKRRIDWSEQQGLIAQAKDSEGAELLDKVTKILEDANGRPLHIRQIAEQLAAQGFLGGEVSEIERAVTAAILVDIHKRGRLSRFAARGDARYQLQSKRLPAPLAAAEKTLYTTLRTLEHEGVHQLSLWLQSLSLRALEALVRIYLEGEGYRLQTTLPPQRGVGRLVVIDRESEADNPKTLVWTISKRSTPETSAWEEELERNECSGMLVFALVGTSEEMDWGDARVIDSWMLARWFRERGIGFCDTKIAVQLIDPTFIESVSGLDT